MRDVLCHVWSLLSSRASFFNKPLRIITSHIAMPPETKTISATGTSDDATSSPAASSDNEVFKLAPFNPSSLEIQEMAMRLLKLTKEDVLFDLGCGDGRLLLAAAQRVEGLRCVGIDIDPIFVERARVAVQEQSMEQRVDIRLQDALSLPLTPTRSTTISSTDIPTCELSLMDDCTALYLFVLPKGVVKLLPLLEALVKTRQEQKRPFRILSYMFKLHQWPPTAVDKTAKAGCPVYLYEF